jgi:hypothetical protein
MSKEQEMNVSASGSADNVFGSLGNAIGNILGITEKE